MYNARRFAQILTYLTMITVFIPSLYSQDLTIEDESQRFWGPKGKLEVPFRSAIKRFDKFWIHEGSLFIGSIVNDNYLYYAISQLRYAHNLERFNSEPLRIEASLTYATSFSNGLKEYLEGTVKLKSAMIVEFIESLYDVNLYWSPPPGQLSVFESYLLPMDVYIGPGVGLLHSTARGRYPGSPFQSKFKPTLNMTIGTNWYINEMFSIRSEYRQHLFKKALDGYSFPIQINIGVSIRG